MSAQPSKKDMENLPHSKQVLFACFCAEQVVYLVREVDKPVCLRAIQTAYLFLKGKATKEDCSAASFASFASYASSADASYAAVAASYAAAAAYASAADAAAASYAASAASAASYAAYAVIASADKSSIIKAQWDFYDQLLNGDKYFEEIVLSRGGR